MIDVNFASDMPRLIRIRKELQRTSHLEENDVNFLRSSTENCGSSRRAL